MLPQCNEFSYDDKRRSTSDRFTGKLSRLFGHSMKPRIVVQSITIIVIMMCAQPSAEAFTVSHTILLSCSGNVAPIATCDSKADVIRAASSNWRLARAQADKSGEVIVSILKTADTMNSDPDFAGLMVRCGARGKIDVLVVLVRPLPPKTRPKVTISAGSESETFEGEMASAGAAVVLPGEAGSLAGGQWQRLPGLAISIGDGADAIKGEVSLVGLGAAYSNLVSNCGM